MRQIVVQGLPWAYTSEELSGLFDEYKPASAEVVFGRDGRSRVRPHPVCGIPESQLAVMPFIACQCSLQSRSAGISRHFAVASSAAKLSTWSIQSLETGYCFRLYTPGSGIALVKTRMVRAGIRNRALRDSRGSSGSDLGVPPDGPRRTHAGGQA